MPSISCDAQPSPPVRPSFELPSSGHLGPTSIGEDIWIVRSLFPLGSGQTAGLTHAGLRGRLLAALGPRPLAHPALSLIGDNESTRDEVTEELAAVQELLAGRDLEFPLDITMTIVRRAGRLALHSVAPLGPELEAAVRGLGSVSLLIVPNLQHWVALPAWLAAFPDAEVALPPAAFAESVEGKVPGLASHPGPVWSLGGPDMPARLKELGLAGGLLQGAPLALNEVIFQHAASGTLIASDSFYGGYIAGETPSWFARLWFKITRDGTFRKPRLPSYRTSRVISHGDRQQVLDCAAQLMEEFGPVVRIVFAHGTSPFTDQQLKNGRAGEKKGWNGHGADLKALYVSCWREGLETAGQEAGGMEVAGQAAGGMEVVGQAAGGMEAVGQAAGPQDCCRTFCTNGSCISKLG